MLMWVAYDIVFIVTYVCWFVVKVLRIGSVTNTYLCALDDAIISLHMIVDHHLSIRLTIVDSHRCHLSSTHAKITLVFTREVLSDISGINDILPFRLDQVTFIAV